MAPFYESRRTLEGDGRETVVVAPFYERKDTDKGTVTSVRPFYERTETADRTTVHVLGPLYRYRRSEEFTHVRILPLYDRTSRNEPPEYRSWFATFFPFVFVGSDDFLIFPIGGHTKGLLGLSEFTVITPFYFRARQRDFITYHVIWPFISWGSDSAQGGRRRTRVWPFYGTTRKRDGTKTVFYAWPFYMKKWRGDEFRSFHSWPFYGRIDTPTTKQRTILFPFYTYRQNYLTGFKDVSIWPFYRRAGGSDDVDADRIWPIYTNRRSRNTTTRWIAWPFWREMRVDEGNVHGKLNWFLPFYVHTRYVNEQGQLHKKKNIWPIGRWETYYDGTKEVQIPKILPFDSPLLRQNFSLFRPFFTLYSSRRLPNGDRDRTWLFTLIRARDTSEESSFNVPLIYQRHGWKKTREKRIRFLYGLLGWERRDGGRYLRFLWGLRIRLGDAK